MRASHRRAKTSSILHCHSLMATNCSLLLGMGCMLQSPSCRHHGQAVTASRPSPSAADASQLQLQPAAATACSTGGQGGAVQSNGPFAAALQHFIRSYQVFARMVSTLHATCLQTTPGLGERASSELLCQAWHPAPSPTKQRPFAKYGILA